MDDQDTDNSTSLARRLADGTVGRLRQLARRGRRRVSGVMQSRLDELSDALRDHLLELLRSREHVEALQQALATVSTWAMHRGFRADPNAELLFEFVNWLEDRHGRQKITFLLLRSPMIGDPAFVEALIHLSKLLAPWSPSQDDSAWDHSRLERFKARAGRRLLDLLVELAALECDSPPPSDTEERIAYFRNAPIPIRFQRLAAMTQGDHLMQRSQSRRLDWVQHTVNRLAPDHRRQSALAPIIPGIGDDGLHFLVFSTTFFLQTYLLRNLIETLPDLAAHLDEALGDEEIIDVGKSSSP